MRRVKQLLPENESIEILRTATNGVLSLVDSENIPYGVPMSFVYDNEDTIYFHCAKEGRKTDCIHKNNNASFCIISLDDIHPDEFTTYYRSVIVSGTITIIQNRNEIIYALKLLGDKYSPKRDAEQEINKNIERVSVLKLNINNITGKEAIELTRRR